MVSDKVYRRMQMGCSCGHVSRSMSEEARHRHNFPMLCKPRPVQCYGTNKDGTRCKRKVLTRAGGACSWHSHQKPEKDTSNV